MSKDFKKRVVADFIAGLNRAWVAAAPPSYVAVERAAEEIMQRSDQPAGGSLVPLPASTVNDLLTKDRYRLPNWDMTFSVLVVFREMVGARGGNPDIVIGTIAKWKTRHEAALKELERVKRTPKSESADAHGVTAGGVALAPGERTPEELNERRFAVADGQRATLLARARQADAWWRGHQGVVPGHREAYLTLERWCSQLRIYDPGGIPGVLQTEDVAYRLARHGASDRPPEWLVRFLGLEMDRRRFLQEVGAARLWILLDESVLRRPSIPAIGPAMWREQLEHLLALSLKPRFSLQIKPVSADDITAGGPVRLLRFREAAFPDVVYLPQPNGGLYPGESIVVHQYAAFLNGQFIAAASPAESIEILRDIIGQF